MIFITVIIFVIIGMSKETIQTQWSAVFGPSCLRRYRSSQFLDTALSTNQSLDISPCRRYMIVVFDNIERCKKYGWLNYINRNRSRSFPPIQQITTTTCADVLESFLFLWSSCVDASREDDDCAAQHCLRCVVDNALEMHQQALNVSLALAHFL